MKDRGIRFEKSSPDTPEQNGDAERQNRSIFDRVRTILIDAGLPLFLWVEAVNYIIYTKNHHVTRALTNTTPFEVHYKKKLDISKLYPFGCKAYVYDYSSKRKKLSLKLLKVFLLGMQRHKRLFGSIFPRREALFVLSMLNAM